MALISLYPNEKKSEGGGELLRLYPKPLDTVAEKTEQGDINEFRKSLEQQYQQSPLDYSPPHYDLYSIRNILDGVVS